MGFHHQRYGKLTNAACRTQHDAPHFVFFAINWRWRRQNSKTLDGMGYLQMHPATLDEKLPDSLVWFHASSVHSEAAWDAAKNSGVTSLMPREEVEQYEDTYDQLKKIDDARALAWGGLNEASR
jgi:hypothetical protein